MSGTLPAQPYVATGPPDYIHGQGRGANHDGNGSLCESQGNTTPLSDFISLPNHHTLGYSNVFHQGDTEAMSPNELTFVTVKDTPFGA